MRTLRILAVAFGLFIVWTGATYMLEGRIETLLRPEAALDRAAYVLVANLLVGTVGALFVLRRFVLAEGIRLGRVGFGSSSRSLKWVIAGLGLGLIMYVLQDPPTMNPVVILNGYAQVLSVSVAEVLVCWVTAGGVVAEVSRAKGKVVSVGLGILAASLLFGMYHFAHSPPFNTMGMVLLLTAVGVATGVFFFLSRDVYGTIAFHNFLGVLGVLQALEQAGQLEMYTVFQVPLIAAAVVAVGLLIALHVLWLRRSRADPIVRRGVA